MTIAIAEKYATLYLNLFRTWTSQTDNFFPATEWDVEVETKFLDSVIDLASEFRQERDATMTKEQCKEQLFKLLFEPMTEIVSSFNWTQGILKRWNEQRWIKKVVRNELSMFISNSF